MSDLDPEAQSKTALQQRTPTLEVLLEMLPRARAVGAASGLAGDSTSSLPTEVFGNLVPDGAPTAAAGQQEPGPRPQNDH